MNRNSAKYTLFNAVTPVAVTSSTDATPIVITATSHGLVTGDFVQIFGHTTNTAANGIFYVTKVDANSFQLQDRALQTNIAGSGGGAGSSGVLVKSPKIIPVQDFRNALLTVITSGTSTMTAKVAGSLGIPVELQAGMNSTGDIPLMGGTISKSNPYSFLNLVELDSNTNITGSTGIVVPGADIQKTYEVNINGMKYINLVVTAWTAGVINVVLELFDNK